MKRAIRWSLLALVLLVLAGLIAPFIRVDHYREQIRAGLQRSLQRKVDIEGNTRLNLFRGPGFSVEKVIIHDDPSIGLEPFANVPELQATVSLSSLWTGRLEFATVRFVEPSLNIVKSEGKPWNLVPLLQSATAIRDSWFPEIQISDGRINFKLDNTKSILYLTDTDLSISPSRDGFDLRFSCHRLARIGEPEAMAPSPGAAVSRAANSISMSSWRGAPSRNCSRLLAASRSACTD